MAESSGYDPSTYQRSAYVYDVMNAARGKSYRDEADVVGALVDDRVPGARTLLDVACGTGLHLVEFAAQYEVAGVEPHDLLRSIAHERLEGVPLHAADMRTFDLADRFDVVTCLFSAIGYMLTPEDLRAAVGRMAAHLGRGGVLIVEPWFHPEAWIDGMVTAEAANIDGLAVARLSHSRRDGHLAHFDFYWTVGRGPTRPSDDGDGEVPVHVDGARGVEQWVEPHRLALWTDAEYRAAFVAAGLDVEHDPDGLIGRGLYIGQKPS